VKACLKLRPCFPAKRVPNDSKPEGATGFRALPNFNLGKAENHALTPFGLPTEESFTDLWSGLFASIYEGSSKAFNEGMSLDNRGSAVRVHLAGGLGNQLFQFAAALRAANGREVRLEFGLLDVRRHHDFLPDLLQYELPGHVKIQPFGIGLLRNRVRRFLNRALLSHSVSRNRDQRFASLRKMSVVVLSLMLRAALGWKSDVIVASNSGYEKRVETNQGEAQMVGYFQTYKYSDHQSTQATLRDLKPKEKNPWVSEMKARAEDAKPIIVHLRLGDYRAEKSFGIPGAEYYREALIYIRERESSAPIWLFSDEPHAALGRMPSELLAELPHVVIAPAGTSAADNLEVMRLGAAYILANSTFGYWAATLSSCDQSLVTIPNPWFRDVPNFVDFAPPSWRRFDAAHA
jgi:hypothetical protein